MQAFSSQNCCNQLTIQPRSNQDPANQDALSPSLPESDSPPVHRIGSSCAVLQSCKAVPTEWRRFAQFLRPPARPNIAHKARFLFQRPSPDRRPGPARPDQKMYIGQAGGKCDCRRNACDGRSSCCLQRRHHCLTPPCTCTILQWGRRHG
jgi:hypothetical protein